MNRLLTAITLLFFMVSMLISGCSGNQPILPDDVAKKIKLNLGYTLAPTWLPAGYNYAGLFPDTIVTGRRLSGEIMSLLYGKDGSSAVGNSMVMSYPIETIVPLGFQEMVDLTPPEDAATETIINGNSAYLYQGGWSEETLRRIAKLEEPIDPEWDYEGKKSIRFTIDVPGKGSIQVSISTILSVEDITQKDLIKIAKSVVVVE